MNEQIHKELAALQQELTRLASVAQQMDVAKALAHSAAQGGKELQEKYAAQLQEIKQMTEQYRQLSQRAEQLVGRIDGINFPERLSKIETSIGTITAMIQQKIDTVNREMKVNSIETRANISSHVEMIANRLNNIKLLIIIILIISLISIGVSIIK